jgi:hypothetical protein
MTETKYAVVKPTHVQCMVCKDWVPEGRQVGKTVTCPSRVCIFKAEPITVDLSTIVSHIPVRLQKDYTATAVWSAEGVPDFRVVIPNLVKYATLWGMLDKTVSDVAHLMYLETREVACGPEGRRFNAARIYRCRLAQEKLGRKPDLAAIALLLAKEDEASKVW